jgi:ATP-binding cassette, subfamily C (CFTR/MRP), member 4
MTEILSGIKIIKMYCWEEYYKKLVEKIRQRELKFQKYLNFISGFNNFIELDFSIVMILVSVTVFVKYSDQPLVPSIIVLTISYYNNLSIKIGFFFTKSLMWFLSARISIHRIQEYLMLEEVSKNNMNINESNKFLRVSNLSAKWNQENDTFSLKNISFSLEENEILGVSGSVGSGKTTLLLALIGEVPCINGSIKKNGQIFYVAQEPWIYTASIKDNILFGKEYNEQRFKDVVQACALDEDIKNFPNREESIIGEKGINLSGGQRARVGLARALYYDADIYLLDDPLSAVDANVAKFLFEKYLILFHL